jgi:SAM-dependent methyltransferase
MSRLSDLDLRIGLAGVALQKRFRNGDKDQNPTTDFSERGIAIFRIPPDLNRIMKDYVADDKVIVFSAKDCAAGYISSDLPDEVVGRINEQNIYFGPPRDAVKNALKSYIDSISDSIALQIGFNFRVVNIRAWQSKPKADFGPSGWHRDGSSQFLPKILIYPEGPNIENGSFEFFDRSGADFIINTKEPIAVLVDSAVLKHRGIASKASLRLIIEITLAPDVSLGHYLEFAGQNARFPFSYLEELESKLSDVTLVPAQAPHGISKVSPPARLEDFLLPIPVNEQSEVGLFNSAWRINIGGGPQFSQDGWINIDEFAGANGLSIRLNNEVVFPYPSGTVETVYSSHCFEHLPIEVIERCLQEVRRLLKSDGCLVIKVPDFDLVVNEYKKNNHVFFGDQWNFQSVSATWPSKGVTDCIESRASMIFCGYWNDHHTHAFGGDPGEATPQKRSFFARLRDRVLQKTPDNLPYHGPATMTPLQFRELVENEASIMKISNVLSDYVRSTEKNFTFNHQTAFSRDEFEALLRRNGFEILSVDSQEICRLQQDIPGIMEMYDISAFYLAKVNNRKS